MCGDAAEAAHAAVDALGPAGGRPLDRELMSLQTGWVSASIQRTDFEAGMAEVSARLSAPFVATATDLDHAVAREPMTVNLDDPHEAWKART